MPSVAIVPPAKHAGGNFVASRVRERLTGRLDAAWGHHRDGARADQLCTFASRSDHTAEQTCG